MEASNLVIKVKYGETLRRFNAQIADGDIGFGMDGLREKIISLFSFSTDAELVLTYIDEDGDVVTLVDDEDLRDAVKQALNPLRINVKLDSGKNGRKISRSSESCTPLRSPHNLKPDLIETVKEPLQEAVVKLSTDLASKASASAPGVAELLDVLSKLALPSAQSVVVPESSTVATEMKDSGKSTDDSATLNVPANGGSDEQLLKNSKTFSIPSQPEGTTEKNEVKNGNLKKTSSSSKAPGSKASTSAVDYKTNAIGKKEKLKKMIGECDKSRIKSSSYQPPIASDALLIERLSELSKAVGLPPVVRINDPNGDEVNNNKPCEPLAAQIAKNGLFVERFNELGKSPGPPPVLMKVVPNGEVVNKPCGPVSGSKDAAAGTSVPPVASNGLFVGKFSEFRKSIDLPPAVNNVANGQEVNNKPCEPKNSVKGESPYGKAESVLSAAFGNSQSQGLNGTVFVKFPSSLSRPPSSIYGCPFSGSAAPSYAAVSSSQAFPFRKNSLFQNGGIAFHRGVRCDGCGVHPITGLRFKSKVKVDYDLCGICFYQMGNETDYIRMDHPALNQSPVPYKGMYGSIVPPTLPHFCKGLKDNSCASKLDSRFIQDINIIDGTILAPLTPFTKIWRMRNNGTVMWPQKTQLLWIGGDKLSSEIAVEVEIPAAGLPVDGELDVVVDFIAPELPGRYISYWNMAQPSGQKFGQRIWVSIQVDASIKKIPAKRARGFNLNLPPLTVGTTGPEPVVEVSSHSGPESWKKTVESVNKPAAAAVDSQPNLEEHDLKFPINDSLLIGTGSGAFNNTVIPCAVSYPIVDRTPVPPPTFPLAAAPTAPPVVAAVNPQASIVPQLSGTMEDDEEKLLRELKGMGFEQVNLNREVLRMNKYNMEQTLDFLCGIAEWYPIILDDPQDMK